MSYLDEIKELNRRYQFTTMIVGDLTDDTHNLDSSKAIWTLTGKTKVAYKRNVRICCFDPSSKNRCVIDIRKLLSGSIIGPGRAKEEDLIWEQYDISIFCKGNITDSENTIGGAIITRPVILKQTSGSMARVIVPGLSATTLQIMVNSAPYGVIHFNGATATGIVTIFRDIEMNDGDVVSIVSTDVFDSDTFDYVITLSGIAQNVKIWDSRA